MEWYEGSIFALEEFCKLRNIFLFEEYMSHFLILQGIIILMIICCVRKWYDDESWFFLECSELRESRRTSASDSNISILDEMRDIFLRDPVESLDIYDFFEIFSHASIELTERDDPFMAIISGEIFYDLFEYYLRSLTPTDDEDMRFGGFPVYFCILYLVFFIFKYRIQNLPDNFTFFWIKIYPRRFKSEKYFRRNFPEYSIRSPRYSIRLMEVEGNS